MATPTAEIRLECPYNCFRNKRNTYCYIGPTEKEDSGKAVAEKGHPSAAKKSASSSSLSSKGAELPAGAPPVRQCRLVRRPGFDGYGFGVLVDEKEQLATVTIVEKGGPAEVGGLRAQDCIVQVNGVNVVGASQRDIVERIKSSTDEVSLLVTTKQAVAWYKERGIPFSSNMPNVIGQRSGTATPRKAVKDQGQKALAKGPSAEPLAQRRPSRTLSMTGSQIMTIEEPSSSDTDQGFLVRRGKEAKAAKPTKPPVKNVKPLAALGPTATVSKYEQELRRKHEQARTPTDKKNEQDGSSAPGPSRGRRASVQWTETTRTEPSTPSGRPGSNSGRSQVRWLPVRSPEATSSPPYTYASQGNDYEAYMEGYMTDAEDNFGWPEDMYSWNAPIPFATSYGAPLAFPNQYEALPSYPYNTFMPYHPQGLYWSQQVPYQGALAPAVSAPYYGYTSTYAPGYSDFFALYPGYASYEPLHQASASPELRERQVAVREAQERPGSSAPTPSLEASSAKSTTRSSAGPSSKVKDKSNDAQSSAPGGKRGEKQAGKKTSNQV